jgi:hypothetical protein
MSEDQAPPAPPPTTTTPGKTAAEEPSREDRLAAKLRENLKKRKEQARLKRAAGQGEE